MVSSFYVSVFFPKQLNIGPHVQYWVRRVVVLTQASVYE